MKIGDDIFVSLVSGDISLHALINQINRQMHLDQDEPELVLKPTLNPRQPHSVCAWHLN